MDSQKQKFEEHFQQTLEESVLQRAEEDLLQLSSHCLLIGCYCRVQEKYAICITHTDPGEDWKKMDEMEKVVKDYLFEMSDELARQLARHFIVEGRAVLLFDSEERMNELYSQVGEHYKDAGPFAVMTIDKTGVVLRENT